MYALEISQLIKTYKSGQQALKGIDLEVAEGDFFALLGANGAGKSTTISIISSLVNKTSGQVAIFGHDIDNDVRQAKLSMGIVPQEINFSQFESCLDVVLNQAGFYGVSRRLAKIRAEKYLTQLGLWERRLSCSRTLSGGMKRRLMIARALMHEPRMLLLDEPTAGVDVELRHSMWEFLTELNRAGTTIVLTTHYLEEAEKLCRNIAIIEQGAIIEKNSMKKLLAKLNKETFILDMRAVLPSSVQADGFTLRRIDDYTLEADIITTQNISALFSDLMAQGMQIASVRNKTSRLESLFLSLLNNDG